MLCPVLSSGRTGPELVFHGFTASESPLNGCPALLLFPYSTLVVGLLIRWRLQTTVGPSEEGVTITLAGSIVARGIATIVSRSRGQLRARHMQTCSDGNHGARASLALPDARRACQKQQRWPNRTERTLKAYEYSLTLYWRHTARALAASRASPLARGACRGD